MKNQDTSSNTTAESEPIEQATTADPNSATPRDVTELNGPKGPEPTRFGDWERKGRCVDF